MNDREEQFWPQVAVQHRYHELRSVELGTLKPGQAFIYASKVHDDDPRIYIRGITTHSRSKPCCYTPLGQSKSYHGRYKDKVVPVHVTGIQGKLYYSNI